MTVRWVESTHGGGTPRERVRSAQATPARADVPAARPAETTRRAADERDRR